MLAVRAPANEGRGWPAVRGPEHIHPDFSAVTEFYRQIALDQHALIDGLPVLGRTRAARFRGVDRATVAVFE
jgi:hypothetical protein